MNVEKQEIKKKKCPRCLQILPATAEFFYRNSSMKSGFQYSCKKCMKKAREIKKKLRREVIEKQKKSDQIDIDNLKEFDITKEIIRNGKLFHFSAVYVAKSRSGKSTNLIYQLKKIREYYDIIIMVTESIQAPIYNNFSFDLLTTGDDNQYKKIINMIRSFQKKTGNSLNFLIVFDDFSSARCKVLRNLYTNARNSNISVVSLVQDTTMVSNHVRYNTLYAFLFNQKNPEAIERLYNFFLKSYVPVPKELRTGYEKKDFILNWFAKSAPMYKPIVLNYDQTSIQTSSSPKLD